MLLYSSVVTSCTKLHSQYTCIQIHIEVPGFSRGVLAHHIAAPFAHCSDKCIKLYTVAVLSVSGAHVNSAICIILYLHSYI